MFIFGPASLKNLEGVHPDLDRVVRRALSYKVMDFSVGEGLRTLERQKELLAKGASTTLKSKHLTGHAVDLHPYPLNQQKVDKGYWPEIIRYGVLAGLMKRAAIEEGVKLRWGCDWDGDGETLDHSFFDAPHFELI